MSDQLESVEKLGTKPYLGSVVVVMIIALPLFGYIWSEYKDLLNEKSEILEKTQELEVAKSTFEKNRADFQILMAQKEAEIDKREFQLEQVKNRIDEVISQLEKRSSYTESLSKELETTKELNYKIATSKAAEEKLLSLMSEFSSLGINLNNSLPCGDKEAEKNYNVAKSKYYEISAMAEANKLEEKYSTFFSMNKQRISSTCIH